MDGTLIQKGAKSIWPSHEAANALAVSRPIHLHERWVNVQRVAEKQEVEDKMQAIAYTIGFFIIMAMWFSLIYLIIHIR